MRKQLPKRAIFLVAGLLCPVLTIAEPVAYIDEAAFLEAVAVLPAAAGFEGFENDALWGAVRTSIVDGVHSAPAVEANGLTWTANNLSSEVTTSEGAARTGLWGFYAYPHGSYTEPDPGADCTVPGECGDGFRGQPVDGSLVAIGGWLRTNTPFAKVGLFLGDWPDNPVDFGETCDPPGSENCVDNAIVGTTPAFFGVVDAAGFPKFEYRELEGKLEQGGGDLKFLFADDFTYVVSGAALIFRDSFE